MNRWWQIGIIIGLIAIGSYGYLALISEQISLIDWLDTIFIIALIFLVSGAGLVFIYSMPFQRLSYNFTYFFSKLKQGSKMADEIERKQKNYKGDELEEKDRPSWTTSLLLSGIILAAFSMVLSLMQNS